MSNRSRKPEVSTRPSKTAGYVVLSPGGHPLKLYADGTLAGGVNATLFPSSSDARKAISREGKRILKEEFGLPASWTDPKNYRIVRVVTPGKGAR